MVVGYVCGFTLLVVIVVRLLLVVLVRLVIVLVLVVVVGMDVVWKCGLVMAVGLLR